MIWNSRRAFFKALEDSEYGSTPECNSCPPVGLVKHTSARPSVDLPDPDSPMTPKVSPARTSKSTPSTALTVSRPLPVRK